MSVVVVGSVAYDSVETPFGKHDDLLGGSATFFSISASVFTSPALVAVVGDDFRDEDVELLRQRGVGLEGLTRAAGRTFRWGGRYHANMNARDTLFTELNVFESFQPELPRSYREAPYVFLGNIHPSLQLSVLEQVESPRFVAADTMNLWIDITRDELVQMLGRIDALFLNDEEAQQLTGAYTMPRAARAIMEMGPKVVVIKRGEHGALLFGPDDTFYAPAFPLDDVVDPTGAGDCYAGGFMGYLAATDDISPENLRRAAVVGSLVASFSVQGFSVERLLGVDLGQVRERYQRFVDLTRFDALPL